MKSEKVSLPGLLKNIISLCVVLSMLMPIAAQALDVLSNPTPGIQLMTLDQQEEQQEDNTEDEKIDMKLLSLYDHLISSATTQFSVIRLESAPDFILEIPIPPPQRA